MATALDVAALLASATRMTGGADFGDPHFLPALDALASAISAEAELAPQRLWRIRAELIALLVERAQIAALVRARPEITQVTIEAPVVITGLPRTGTTVLHNLLAAHPEHRALRLWEMRAPIRPERPGEGWEATAIADAQRTLDELYRCAPGFEAIHPMHARAPDECSWLFRRSFATLVYAFTFHVPSYARWIGEADMVPYYEHYRLQLQLLRWQGLTGRLLLKDPCHLWHLDALLAVFPDAHVILLHRRVDEALPSLASLCHALHRMQSRRSDPTALGPYVLDLVERGLHGMMCLRQAAGPSRLHDLRFRDLVADPVATVTRSLELIGAPVTEPALDAMTRWLAANPRYKGGVHRYSAPDVGLAPGALRRLFRRYEDTFL